MVNQTQLPSFKSGKINEKEVLVAAIPANQMKNYNLFLSMPVELMGDKTISLSNVLLIGSICSLFFIIVISVILSFSINGPMNILKKNVQSI
jgi:ABC-type multidrug transport system permease subunit